MTRNFGLASRSGVGANHQTGSTGAVTPLRDAKVIQLLPSGRVLPPAPTSERPSTAARIFSSLKKLAIDLLAVTAWVVLTVATASAIVASVFTCLFVAL